ncbi:MAG: hypothetical protein CR980_00885 [Propionibacteriales bacterium]|nr:MAG: hypothetical protein CR980_00885 [Propionibacteriales bacterium]
MLRILLVGSIGCGKTSFRQQLQDLPIQYSKTQAIEALPIQYSKTQAIEAMAGVIDTPGEYLEMGRYNHALMLASYDVDLVVLMHAATSKDTRYPPGFASMFNRRVLGVVTKIDLVPRFRVAQARERLAKGLTRFGGCWPMNHKRDGGLDLRNLVDVAQLQQIQDSFAAETGLAMITVDARGVPVTERDRGPSVCVSMSRRPGGFFGVDHVGRTLSGCAAVWSGAAGPRATRAASDGEYKR